MLFTYVKIDESVKACIREEIVKCEAIDLVSAATTYESLDMTNTYLGEKVTSLEKSLQNCQKMRLKVSKRRSKN